MDISGLKRDASSIEAGRWIGDIPGCGDMRLKVRGLSSRAFEHARGRLLRALPRDQRDRDGTPLPDAAGRCFGLALAEAVLLDWDGITDSGQSVPFDAALARRWLTEPDFEPFRDAVVWAARVADNEAAARAEAVEGN